MPNRSSSDSSKGRGRSSGRSRGEGNFQGKRSSPKRGDDDKKNNERSPFSNRADRPQRPSRFKDSGDNKGERNQGPSSSKRPRSSNRFNEGGDSRGERKEGSSYSKRPRSSNRFNDGGENSGERKPRSSYSKRSSDERPNRFNDGADNRSERKQRPFNSKFSDRSNRSNDKGDSSGDRNEKKPFSKYSSRTSRPTRSEGGGDFPKKNWRKSGEEGSRQDRSEFKGNRDNKFRSDRKHSSDDKPSYPKFDKSAFRKKGSKQQDSGQPQSEEAATGKIRLNKFIANSGVCSRREADNLITLGLISVNGVTITELGYKVNPTDEVRHEGKVLRREKPVYILMNKPKGFLTTTADPEERNTVMHLISNLVKERVYPVGRLDRNTTGLLLLTNDGDLAEKLMHPSYNVKKIYKVDLDRPLTKNDAQRIIDGVRLEEGVAMVDDLAIISEDRKTVGLEIHIGWNRVVRRIFESLEYEVVKLDRSVYAGLTKKDLGRGEWRFLKKEELVILKHLQ